jgi:hypothetical protein
MSNKRTLLLISLVIGKQDANWLNQQVVTHGEDVKKHDFPYQAATWLCRVS